MGLRLRSLLALPALAQEREAEMPGLPGQQPRERVNQITGRPERFNETSGEWEPLPEGAVPGAHAGRATSPPPAPSGIRASPSIGFGSAPAHTPTIPPPSNPSIFGFEFPRNPDGSLKWPWEGGQAPAPAPVAPETITPPDLSAPSLPDYAQQYLDTSQNFTAPTINMPEYQHMPDAPTSTADPAFAYLAARAKDRNASVHQVLSQMAQLQQQNDPSVTRGRHPMLSRIGELLSYAGAYGWENVGQGATDMMQRERDTHNQIQMDALRLQLQGLSADDAMAEAIARNASAGHAADETNATRRFSRDTADTQGENTWNLSGAQMQHEDAWRSLAARQDAAQRAYQLQHELDQEHQQAVQGLIGVPGFENAGEEAYSRQFNPDTAQQVGRVATQDRQTVQLYTYLQAQRPNQRLAILRRFNPNIRQADVEDAALARGLNMALTGPNAAQAMRELAPILRTQGLMGAAQAPAQ